MGEIILAPRSNQYKQYGRRKDDRTLIPSLSMQMRGIESSVRMRGDKKTDYPDGAYPYVPIGDFLSVPLLDTDAILDDWVNDRLRIKYSQD